MLKIRLASISECLSSVDLRAHHARLAHGLVSDLGKPLNDEIPD